MLLYKFRQFSRLDRLLDIVLNERVYCPEYSNLNDPFEGVFFTALKLRPQGLHDIDPENFRKARVCSFSKDFCDVRMWSFYGEEHRGVAVEIDFENRRDDIDEVSYSESLPSFAIPALTVRQALSRKTKHWEYEQEFRYVTNEDRYYSISGRVRRIILGPLFPDENRELLNRILDGRIPLQRTSLNYETVEVVEQST